MSAQGFECDRCGSSPLQAEEFDRERRWTFGAMCGLALFALAFGLVIGATYRVNQETECLLRESAQITAEAQRIQNAKNATMQTVYVHPDPAFSLRADGQIIAKTVHVDRLEIGRCAAEVHGMDVRWVCEN